MQCDHCDNKATVFYTQIIDGISKKSSLCQSCATKQGVTDPEGFLLGSKDTAASGKPTTPKAMPQLETTMGKKASRCCQTRYLGVKCGSNSKSGLPENSRTSSLSSSNTRSGSS